MAEEGAAKVEAAPLSPDLLSEREKIIAKCYEGTSSSAKLKFDVRGERDLAEGLPVDKEALTYGELVSFLSFFLRNRQNGTPIRSACRSDVPIRSVPISSTPRCCSVQRTLLL